jgi:hypothetical protein
MVSTIPYEMAPVKDSAESTMTKVDSKVETNQVQNQILP